MSTVTTSPQPSPQPSESLDDGGKAGLLSASTTPGWYRLVGLVIIVVIMVFAAVATTATLVTRSATQTIRSNTAPSLIAVQGLSASVAEANAAAAAVFLSATTGTEDRSRRVQYLEALERSAEQTEDVASLIGDDSRSHEALQAVSVSLTTYSGEIESSRTANELGGDGADDTLRSALDLTQSEIASAVATVTDRNQQRFDDESGTGLELTIAALATGLVTLIALVWFQIRVTRRSNRVINIGLLVATGLVAATVIVIANGMITRSLALSNAESGGYDAIAATSRLQASANELQSQVSLLLLGGESGGVDVLIADIDTGVSSIADDADSSRERAAAAQLTTRWGRYRDTVQSIVTDADRGAVDQATAEFQSTGLSTFNGLNTSIEGVLSDNRAQFSDGIEAAADAVDLLPLFSLVLPMVAILGVVLGVQGRLRDYQ